jgi:cytochrome c oxidase cbb3-type subunit 2
MPGYPWLLESTVEGELIQHKMRALQTLGDPYSDEEIAAAADAVAGKTEMQALIAYLQGLGLARSNR